MDIDRFIASRSPIWTRLDQLVHAARHNIAKLSPSEVRELVALYESTSADLSVVRTQYDEIALVNNLSARLGAAQGLIYQRRRATRRGIATFFIDTLPRSAYRCRRSVLFAAALLFLPALGLGFWMYAHPEARSLEIDDTTQELIAESEFEEYYSANPAHVWSFELFTHNIQVSVLAFGGALAGGVLGISQLLNEAVRLGTMAAVMHAYDKGPLFWGLIIPHGLLELSAVCLAGGAGFHVVWSAIRPGYRLRRIAAAEEGLVAINLLIGAMMCFVVAGFVEAFVTPAPIGTAFRVTIGVVLECAMLIWFFGVGRVRSLNYVSSDSETARLIGVPSISG